MTDASGGRYGAVARAFHWLVVALLLAQYVIALLLPRVLPKSSEDSVAAWHFAVGSTILLAMALRLAWRATHRPPPPPADLSAALRLVSRLTHGLLYFGLILQPVLGWTAASAYGATPYLLGVVPLPRLVGKDVPFGEAVGAVHGTVGVVLLGLIALHVGGALFHGVVKRDGVMRRMLAG